ncbi:class F sortase, partial [Paenibacillus apiarius]|nr:class F sortase [Paenibacillus apiarius]
PLPRSAPVTISIPRIGVQAPIMSLGTNPDGTVQVPPLDQAMNAGWYSPGASPGEAGNAVIVGHVDSAQLGPAVFFNLGALVAGDTIVVARQDGSSATFTVREVASYPKTAFPAAQVYGPSDVPALRVVTCGGVFDKTAGSYLNNIVVYAPMTS